MYHNIVYGVRWMHSYPQTLLSWYNIYIAMATTLGYHASVEYDINNIMVPVHVFSEIYPADFIQTH